MLELLRFEFRRLSKSIFYRIVGVYCIVWPVIVVLLLRLILGLFMKDSGLNFADIGLDKGEIRYLDLHYERKVLLTDQYQGLIDCLTLDQRKSSTTLIFC